MQPAPSSPELRVFVPTLMIKPAAFVYTRTHMRACASRSPTHTPEGDRRWRPGEVIWENVRRDKNIPAKLMGRPQFEEFSALDQRRRRRRNGNVPRLMFNSGMKPLIPEGVCVGVCVWRSCGQFAHRYWSCVPPLPRLRTSGAAGFCSPAPRAPRAGPAGASAGGASPPLVLFLGGPCVSAALCRFSPLLPEISCCQAPGPTPNQKLVFAVPGEDDLISCF